MSWTVTSLATAIITNVGGRTGDTALLTEIKAWVNEGYKYLIRDYAWPWCFKRETIAVTTPTATYALATNAIDVVGARLAGDQDRPLAYRDPLSFLATDLEEIAPPTNYYISGYDGSTEKLQITLHPIPDTSYTLEVFENLRALNLADGTTIPCPEEFVDIIKEMVKYRIFRDDGDNDGAALARADWKEMIAQAKHRLGHVSAIRRTMRTSDVKIGGSGPQQVQFDPSRYEGWNF